MANPYVANAPYISIAATDYYAKAKMVKLTPTDNMADAETFGNPGFEIPSSATWTFELEWPQEFDTGALWNVLEPLQYTQIAIILSPASGVAAATNPTATFNIVCPSVPFLDVTIGSSSISNISAKTIGAPVFATS
jgi:hypothetical protein